MKDLTKDSITLHILTMAGPAIITMLVQVAHQIITLHFVSGLGTDALAAVSAAGNAGFIVGALIQILNVGTVALVAHAAGRKDFADIRVLLGQAIGLSFVSAFATVCILWILARVYMATLSQDAAVIDLGVQFLWWVSPGFALLFPLTALSATCRGLGVVTAPMFIFTLIIVLDAVFAAAMIPGFGPIPSLGVEGAGLATTLANTIGLIVLLVYFLRTERQIPIQRQLLQPRLAVWRRLFVLGLPAAAELTLMFLSVSTVYLVIRDQGTAAQAGLGMGYRVLQALMLPGLAISLAAAPIAGQNFGARNASRVREVFRTTSYLSAIAMLITTLLIQWQPEAALRLFEADTASAATAISFLQIMAWTLVFQGLVYTCAFMFQALGNTLPALLSAIARFLVFSLPALWLSQQPGFHTRHVWYLLTASIAVQAVVSLCLLQVEFKRKLQPLAAESNNPTATSAPLASCTPESRGHVDPTQTL